MRKGAGISENYTVRKISNGVGERIFPIHTPRVEKDRDYSFDKVRRARIVLLAYLQVRQLVSKKSIVNSMIKNSAYGLGFSLAP